MKSPNKAMVLTFAERCKNILTGNWQGQLNTVKADAKGSKEAIHSSMVKYLFKRGKPYIWIREGDLHNVNVIIDERGSLAVVNSIPGSLVSLLKSIKKLPPRVALTGDVVSLKDEKVQFATENLRETILSEQKEISQASYAVSGILSSSSINCKSRSENFQEILDGSDSCSIYKFNIRSCTYIDGNGGTHEVELNDIGTSKGDRLSPFSAKLIDGINQNQARRRALMLLCFVHLNKHARDAFLLSVDRKGFDVLARVPSYSSAKDGLTQYEWKEFRFTLKEEANHIETFCCQLAEMEEEAIKSVNNFSGLG
eukprot:TRINITY_DN21820_c0_g1_i1.p1 TRINITY_DN21820_c0_g1~~TRINITY_DN21820_c0_g1_i1.p1  ORF type:complete len:311 (+),score=43.06 TRINITY_DN21820_c0_g1_i1:104-1036(+)